MDHVRSLTITEEEWRLLVDLIGGFSLAHYHPVQFDRAMEGLIRNGLVEEVRNGTRVTSLGYRVRAEQPRYIAGRPRIWQGVIEPEKRGAEVGVDPPA